MSAKDDINRIPYGGSWVKDGNVRFMAAYAQLRKLGMTHEDAIDFLSDLYVAVAQEYGE